MGAQFCCPRSNAENPPDLPEAQAVIVVHYQSFALIVRQFTQGLPDMRQLNPAIGFWGNGQVG